MKKSKRVQLERAGWRVGTAGEFLGLTDEEVVLIEMKLALAREIKERRLANHLTQSDLAQKLGSSQSRVAKMEAADSTVSLELLVRCLLALGADSGVVGRTLAKKTATSIR